MLSLRQYRAGDIAAIPCDEADPAPGWADHLERVAGGIATIECDGLRLAVIGFTLVTPGVADSFAVIDRHNALGRGRGLADLTACQTAIWMGTHSIHRAAATCSPHDKPAQVFLRAVGYRKECLLEAAAADGSDLLQFKLIRR